MPVGGCIPCAWDRWSFGTFGVLATDNTCHFRGPLCTQRSGRLFLQGLLITREQTLADHHTRIAIRISTHLTRRTKHERSTWGIALSRLACRIPSDQRVATRAFPARLTWTDAAGEDALVPRFVPGIGENTSLHPVRAFGIPTTAIPASLWLEIAQVFKHQNAGPLLPGKLDNPRAHQMRELFITLRDLSPEVHIVLFALCDDARLPSVAGNPSKQLRAFSRLSLCHRQ